MLKTTSILASILTVAALGACGPNSRDGGGGGGGNGDGGNGGSGGSGSNVGDCSADAKLIYTIDDANDLATFNAETKQFNPLGTLNCSANSDNPSETPFSMAVDRTANLYVLYHDPLLDTSTVYHVDPMTLACTKTAWTTQLNEEAFGMGFSTDVSGGDTDTLFIAGTVDDGTQPTTVTLASVDVTTMTASGKGSITGQPELTGTGDAKLWGYFPNTGKIQEINKTSGGTIGSPFGNASITTDMPGAWAFAFYGGDFYVFLASQADVTAGNPTIVHQVGMDGSDKGHTTAPAGHFIVGAGVSTCAPLVIGKETE